MGLDGGTYLIRIRLNSHVFRLISPFTMAKPSLYYLPLSPPSRAVLITAHLLNIELELVPVDLMAGEHLKPEFLKVRCHSHTPSVHLSTSRFTFGIQMNPQHTIPLLNDGGAIVYDSHAICTYLVEKYGDEQQQQHLYPKDLVQRAQVDARLHFDTGVLFARVRMLFEPVLYFGRKELNAESIEYVQRAWPLLEAFLQHGDYLCGDRLTLGDVACAASVCSTDAIAPIDPVAFPKLRRWLQRMAAELPHYERDCADGGRKLQEFVKQMAA